MADLFHIKTISFNDGDAIVEYRLFGRDLDTACSAEVFIRDRKKVKSSYKEDAKCPRLIFTPEKRVCISMQYGYSNCDFPLIEAAIADHFKMNYT